jgi:hypothetical protein
MAGPDPAISSYQERIRIKDGWDYALTGTEVAKGTDAAISFLSLFGPEYSLFAGCEIAVPRPGNFLIPRLNLLA